MKRLICFSLNLLLICLLTGLLIVSCQQSEDTSTNALTFAVFTPTDVGWTAIVVTSEPLIDTDIEVSSDVAVVFSGFESYPHMGGKSECVFILTSESEKITVAISSLDFTVELTGDKRITRS